MHLKKNLFSKSKIPLITNRKKIQLKTTLAHHVKNQQKKTDHLYPRADMNNPDEDNNSSTRVTLRMHIIHESPLHSSPRG